MSLTRRELPGLFGLLIAVGAGIASLVVWDDGRVDIGMTLHTPDGHDGQVFVADVTPDGNAARNHFSPGWALLELTTVDGGEIARGEPLGADIGAAIVEEPMAWEYLGPIGAELTVFDADFRPPAEAIPSARIATAVAGNVYRQDAWIDVLAAINRDQLESELRGSIWLMALGIAAGIGAWRLLAHGIAGSTGREHAVLLGSAAATPFLLVPLVQVGNPIGIFAGYLVPAGLALVLGLSLARAHPDRAWVQTATAGALVAAGLALTLVIRHMTAPALEPNERGSILAIIAAIAIVPALIASTAMPRLRDRAGYLSLALVPAAALTVILPSSPDPVPPIILLLGLLGWQALPADQAMATLGSRWSGIVPSGSGATGADPEVAAWRDRVTFGLLSLVTAFSIVQPDSAAAIWGIGLAAAVGFAVWRGFLGPDWTDAAIPLAAAVGIPVMLLAFPAWDYGGAMGWASSATALPALSVAHLLASRHSDPRWRSRLFLGSVALAALVIWLGGIELPFALIMAGLIALIPGIPAAFARQQGEARAMTVRLETLAVALTPGAAATVLAGGTNGLLLGAWLVAIIIWRRFTLAPLLGIARRTQLQRDLAVAAAETERARLAADLHDDALQQLSMLVRTLDEGGHEKEAAEAREVATKLRSVVGDLRLPILDDLGAGAALEWLVERVEPLAGGPVKLERSDETRPPANVELAVFRVAQEALTNAIKHGRPPIAVHYDVRADGRVTLAIDDAGPGIGAEQVAEAPGQGHFGLANMQQRAEQVGALLDVRRWPAGGTRVALEWRPG